MSLSLVAVFIPILLMGGIVGRLFREFAVTLSVAILISLVVSLTTTPMMCARAAASREHEAQHGRLYRVERARSSTGCCARYERSLDWALRHRARHDADLLAATIGAERLSVHRSCPRASSPQQDTGRMIGGIQADQSISFQAMQQKLADFVTIIAQRPGGARTWSASPAAASANSRLHVHLAEAARPSASMSADQVIARLRRKLAHVPGAQPVPAAGAGPPRRRPAEQRAYQYTLQADDLDDAAHLGAAPAAARWPTCPSWPTSTPTSRITALQTSLTIDRDTAARLGHHAAGTSTTRSTTPSASARSRPSTTRSTSITW